MVAPTRTVDPTYIPVDVTTPAGTQIAAPLVTTPKLDHAILQQVAIQIPAGHCGVTGLRILLSGQQVFPWSNTAAWLRGDNFYDVFDFGIEIDTKLTVVTYNLGNFDHTHFLRFKVKQFDDVRTLAPVTLIPNSQLSA